MSRLTDVRRFYELLERLRELIGGPWELASFGRWRALPDRGAYFFFEETELRRQSGAGLRVVRVGTHGLSAGSHSTLQQRLRQHRGLASGSGNHRGSIFRLLVGQALLARGDFGPCASWGIKSDAGKAGLALGIDREAVLVSEDEIEKAVTQYIGRMPFLWLDVEDAPGPDSLRGMIERNSIALLSNLRRTPIDPASNQWLGHFSDRALVHGSGLWNQRHVEEAHDPAFLSTLDRLIVRIERSV
jgi:hypothetical protein